MYRVPALLLWLATIGSLWAQSPRDSISRGSVALVSGLSSGSFHRAMDPGQAYFVGFDTEGETAIDRWKLKGRFAYQRQFHEDVLFAGVRDPYNGIPFIWGDTLSGNWRHDGFDTGLDLTMPRYKNLVFGFAVDYINATGARENGPKPFYRYRDIKIAPRIKTLLAGREDHFVVAEVSYASAFEENEIGYYARNNTYLIRGRGYGSALKGPIQSLDRRRKSERFGIGMQWAYVDRWHVDVGSQYRKDIVKDGLADPNKDGDYSEFSGFGKIDYNAPKVGYGLAMHYRSGKTDDAVFGFRNSEARQIGAEITVDADRQGNRPIVPEFSLGILFDKQEDYIVYADYENLNLTAKLGRTNEIKTIRLAWGIGYQLNLDGQGSVLDPDLLSHLIYDPDFDYRTSDHVFIGFDPMIRLGSGKSGKNRFYIKLKNRLLAKSTSSMRYVGEIALGMDL